MSEQQSSYRQIFKATSLFGGVQVFQILIGIIKTKFVAILLGAAGVGIMGLYNSPLQLILSITGLGIAFSAVRYISEAHGNNDMNSLSKVIITFRRWTWFAGILGTIVTIALSPLLSQWTFGSQEYTWSFIWLSITILLQTISKSQIAVIQGTRRMKDMAKASAYGSLIGLFTAVPLFYYFGAKGIVTSFILAAVAGLLISWQYSRKVKIEPVNMTYHETYVFGKKMVNLGLIMTLTGIIGYMTGYILNAFISRTGGVDQVGLYNAGWSIIGQSTGLVFAAMSIDYYPRLSAVNQQHSIVNNLVNQQAEMVLIILTPIIILLICTMPIIVHILYTSDFFGVISFANWTVLSIVLKGLVWPVGFIFPAKGDMKTFATIEIVAMIFNIITNVLGYYLFGLEGLGVSFIINYLLGLALTLFMAYKKYGFRYNKSTLNRFIISSFCVTSVFLISYFIKRPGCYYYGAIVFTISAIYTLIELNKKIGLSSLLKSLRGSISKKTE